MGGYARGQPGRGMMGDFEMVVSGEVDSSGEVRGLWHCKKARGMPGYKHNDYLECLAIQENA